MIETLHLQPADLGPRSNPLLFGIAEAIAEMLPLTIPAPRPVEDGSRGGSDAAPVEDRSEQATGG